MSDIALGYGSKWHLLRYLGYHRETLSNAVERETGGHVERWLDHPFDAGKCLLDRELKGLEFLSNDLSLKDTWREFWPQTGNVHNWDTVGWLQNDAQVDLLLVEAKAHVGEIKSCCGAKEQGGLSQITRAFQETKAAFGVQADPNWLEPYYQYCNRLATLYFLMRHGVSARLVFIYFAGDKNPHGDCPLDEAAWRVALEPMKAQLGLTGRSELERRVHEVFLPVCLSKAHGANQAC